MRCPVSVRATVYLVGAFVLFSGCRTQPLQRLLHVALPGIGSETNHGGVGFLVLDADHEHKVVRRVSTWYPAVSDEAVRDIAANAKTARLFISTTKRLVALDLLNDRVIWNGRA
jgi:hypothetical protein